MVVTGYQFFNGQISGAEASIDLIIGGIGFTGWGAPIPAILRMFKNERSAVRSLQLRTNKNRSYFQIIFTIIACYS